MSKPHFDSEGRKQMTYGNTLSRCRNGKTLWQAHLWYKLLLYTGWGSGTPTGWASGSSYTNYCCIQAGYVGPLQGGHQDTLILTIALYRLGKWDPYRVGIRDLWYLLLLYIYRLGKWDPYKVGIRDFFTATYSLFEMLALEERTQVRLVSFP